MSRILITLSLSLAVYVLALVGLFGLQSVWAGCGSPARCDAPPGSCSFTCNGNQPCQVNNGGYFYQEVCVANSCRCEDQGGFFLGNCSVNGSLCGGVGSDPYNVNVGDYGYCSCDLQSCTTEVVFTCTETTWESCCTPGSPPPSGSGNPGYCGDNICDPNLGENQTTCESDCGSPTSGTSCGDGQCNGGERCFNGTSGCSDCGTCLPSGDTCGNGVCGPTEACGQCISDCGSCLQCGNGSCNAAAGETCDSCALDCGACPDSCGDNQCTGFETCESCPGDCGGVCIASDNEPWWQASTGHVFAGNTNGTAIQSQIFSTFCLSPDCIALLITPDSTTNAESEGIAITGGGGINTNGFTNTADSAAVGSRATRFTENYGFFYRNSNLGLNPVDDFAGQENDIQKPTTGKDAYFHRGSLTLQTLWTVGAGESYTIFIDGNLTITDPTNLNQLTDVAEGGFLAFIVSGDILIEESVGNENPADTTSNLEGIFVTDGNLTTESRGPVNGDERFVGEGTFVSWSQVNLDRNLTGDSSPGDENQGVPAETFIFRPDFIKNIPAGLTRPHSIWQESN